MNLHVQRASLMVGGKMEDITNRQYPKYPIKMRAKCLKCGDIVEESVVANELVFCACGNISINNGAVGIQDRAFYKSLSEYSLGVSNGD